MTRWEYARLASTGAGVDVVFTHREAWPRQGADEFFATLRRLGDEGWEMVAVLPLAVAEKAGGYSVEPDRWVMLKRPMPEAPAGQEMKGEDVLKGLVGRQLLKGRLPLP